MKVQSATRATIVAVLASQACFIDITNPNKDDAYACETQEDCVSGYECRDHLCSRPPQGDPLDSGCSNQRIDSGEVCDDGNTISGDGCRSDCAGKELCGDGLIDVKEECDDSNTSDGDGCSAQCAVEHAFSCDGEPSDCHSTCGDGLVASNEACDYVVVRQQQNAENGDIVVALLGEEATLKRLRIADEYIELRPESPHQRLPIVVTKNDELRIQGKVIGVSKRAEARLRH